MSDIQQRIAAILADQWAPSRIVYGTDEPIGFDSPRHWAEYVAEVLVSELGLTQQRANIYDDGSTTPNRTEIRYVTEWVSE